MTTTTQKKRPSRGAKPSKQPDLKAMERVMTEATGQTARITSRIRGVRAEQQRRVNELNRELKEFGERKRILTSQYDAAIYSLEAHERDIEASLAVLTGGLQPEAVAAPAPQIRMHSTTEQSCLADGSGLADAVEALRNAAE